MYGIMKKILLLAIVCLCIAVSVGCSSHPQTTVESPNTDTDIEPWCISKTYDSDVDIWALVENNKEYFHADLKTDGTLGDISTKLVAKKLPNNNIDHSEVLRILFFNNAIDANNAYKKLLVGDCSSSYLCDVSAFSCSIIQVGTQVVINQYGWESGNGKMLRSLLTSAKLDFPNTIDNNVSKNKVSEYSGEIDLESTLENFTDKGYEVVSFVDIPSDRECVYLIFSNEGLLVGRIESCELEIGYSIEDLATWLSEGYGDSFEILFTQGGIIITKYDDTLDDMIISKC